MPYTPVELRHVRVGRSLFGYKRGAVQALLNEIADSFETVWRERHELADTVESLEHELEQLRGRENALTQTLVAAEQAATHVREQANREAELILAEARSEARAATRKAESERERLRGEARRVEALLRAALGMLDEGAGGENAAAAAVWPREGETPDPAAEHEQDPAQQPELANVSGLPAFDWGGEKEA
jgi:cell division initiation protein